jgi:hypothetical protein
MRSAILDFLLAASVLAIGYLGGFAARAQRAEALGSTPGDQQVKASVWMKQKLVATQNILEGMTRADYEMIGKNAAGMQLLSYLEAWVRADLPDYRAQLRAFEHANSAIVRAARDKNLDGVTIAYTQLTISCMQCHKIVRDKLSE